MKIGYARVSRKDQNLQLQLRALRREGCARIFQEKKSGTIRRRPALDAALAALKKGDVLVVWRLDRLGRTARDLVNLEHEMRCEGHGLKSLTQSIDTTTPTGRFFFHIFCAVAELERADISARTTAGLHAARHEGSVLGRPRRLSPARRAEARRLARTRDYSVDALARKFKVGKATMQRVLAPQKRTKR